ncbi:MAG: aldehyde ferredoxin oxidoreductase N-terminal domain-containing protein [Desulfobacterales bacterium]
MAEEIFGLTGRILDVNLEGGSFRDRDTMPYAERFLGGRGIATSIYWQEVTPDTGALEPENRLIFMAGALVATGAQGATRMTIMGKSPMRMPEGFCYGNLGGFFPAYLKRAGYDGVVVSGRAEKPVYVLVKDGVPELRDASELWGKGTYEVQKRLKETHGSKVRFVSIGPAGENQCRNATVITDHEGSATGGFGAVMGSKNLKAIAVLGTGRPAVYDSERLSELNRHVIHISKRGQLRMPVPKKQMQFVKTASCFQCAMECGRGLYRTPQGREEVRKCQAMVVYMQYAAQRSDQGIDTALDTTHLCNDYGFCTMELQNILLWLENCYQAGVLSDADTGLEIDKLGTYEFVEQLVSMIGHRRGFGDILAEGILRAGDRLGDEAKSQFTEFSNAVGLAGTYTPRQYTLTALSYGMEPRQPIAQLHDVSHLIARWLLHRIRPDLSPTTAEVFRKATVKFWKSDKAWDMTTFEGKARASTKVQDRTYAKDSLGLCDFGWPIMDSFNTEDNVGDPSLENQLFSAVTGIETDEDGLNFFGERIFNLQRAILLREGWKPVEDDAPPEFNFTDPIVFDKLNPQLIVPGPTEEPVSVKGRVLDRAEFEQMRRRYYKLRGWEPETGLQPAGLFAALDMAEVGEALSASNPAG